MIPQFKRTELRRFSLLTARGTAIAVAGLFKKVVLADSFARFASPAFQHVDAGRAISSFWARIATLAYALRLFRLFRYGRRVRHTIANQFPLTLQSVFDHRFLAAMTHHSVAVPAGLPLHSIGR